MILELHLRNVTHLIIVKSKELLAQFIVVFSIPFIRQELLNLVTALDKGISVAPDRVRRVRHLELCWIPWTECESECLLTSGGDLTGCSIHLEPL